MLGWLDGSNKNLPYDKAVKPANFLLHFQIDPHAIRPGDLPPNIDAFALRPIAPFDRDPAKAMAHAIDRDMKIPIPAHALKSLKTALAQYQLHPESKFANADYLDSGMTELRHIEVCGVVHIGKEANRLDEQIHGGLDEDAQVEYGLDEEWEAIRSDLAERIKPGMYRALGRIMGCSRHAEMRASSGSDEARSGGPRAGTTAEGLRRQGAIVFRRGGTPTGGG